LEVQDQNGNVLEQFSPNPKNVLTKNTALTISDILSDNKARTPTFGANSVLNIPNTAVKTGTTNNDKDAWTIGYTPSISVGVWVGNNDNTPMKNGGVALAGPIWNKFMLAAMQNLPTEEFEKPDLTSDPTTVKPALRGFWQGNDNFFIDKISGKLATTETPPETKEEKVVTNVHSILYWVDRNNITGPPPANPTNDPQYEHWEIPIQNWWAENSYKYPITTWADEPTTTDDIHIDANKPIVSVMEPDTTTVYDPNQKIQLKISSTGHYPLQKIDIFINNVYLGTSEPPFDFSFTPSSLDELKGINDLKIISYDTVYNRGETDTTFQVTQ
jgi:membrane carboxypeptidase/penicillin-binding protein PbpC